MNIQTFIDQCPYLYHLTDGRNLPQIIKLNKILSTQKVVELANYPNSNEFLKQKRPNHTVVNLNGEEIRIRDQQPISMVVLERSLSDGMTGAEFIYLLNKRVFFWPNTDRLNRHYQRYINEQPIILRFLSSDILELHPDAEFCSLNSGATRCHPAYGGNAPTRGKETFQNAKKYSDTVRSVAEVTVLDYCYLPKKFEVSSTPNGDWKEYIK